MKKIILSFLTIIFLNAPLLGEFVFLYNFERDVSGTGMWIKGETKIDYSSISKKNGYSYVWLLSNYSRNDLPHEHGYKSFSDVTLREIDCSEPRGSRLVVTKSYSNFNAKGKLISQSDFRQYDLPFDIEEPGKRNHIIDIVCNRTNR